MSDQKTNQMIRDFLRMQRGRTLDGILASRLMNDIWGIKIDWHEFSSALDTLATNGEATRQSGQPGSLIKYLIN